MKKLVSVVAALVLCLAMTTTAFAASPVKSTVKNAPEGTVQAEVAPEVATAIAEATSEANLPTVLGGQKGHVVSTFDLTVTTSGEVEVAVTGIKAGDNVKVLHWVGGDMTKAPEVLDAVAADGSVKFYATSGSPFAVVVLDGTVSTTKNASGATATAATTATSPKTAEAGMMTALIVMLLSAAGIVVLNKKKFA